MNKSKKDSVNSHFSGLEDPRRINANIRHKFTDIISIAMCAVICGCDDWVSVVTFAKAKEEWFSGFLELPNGIPSHDTFSNVFSRISSEKFEQCFRSWIGEIAETIPDEVIAIDGKTLCHSYQQKKLQNAIHMVSAYATEKHLVLGQIKTAEKSNEITAIPALLKMLELNGCLVTIDAMGCQKEIVKEVVNLGANYLIAVKDNQPSLHKNIKEVFNGEENIKAFDHAQTIDNGHGRNEVRNCWVCRDIPENFSKKWCELKTFIKVEAQRTIKEEATLETRYFISSSNKDAKYLLDSTRKHWAIENSLHWILDVSFREDDSRIRKGNGAENFAILRHIALNLLKNNKTKKVGIKTKRLCAGWENNYLKELLNDLIL